ncbi:hypothetical protein B0H10DRAFT_1404773 [Mycena sp. CBHHK59/15]|nr:hypothetical protein B0H10DRAFT_1404773 [Mycena sp. CBHHK59/15]
MSYRPKGNGPMCFVEFEDVSYATKTLNELYGNTLGGLIKGGGIRLSYSKNPLGVRTPTSAGSNVGAPSLQQQQQQQFGAAEVAFHPRLTSPPPEAGYLPAAPAPRFFGSASSGSSAGGGAFVPRALYGFAASVGVNGAPPSSSFSPFSSSPAPPEQPAAEEQQQQQP